ncbi:MAG: DUF3387 domain-containing protein [Firmicutes bacterium]|nr:DUF3387 domain-containing protein [Bacillota bacterium]
MTVFFVTIDRAEGLPPIPLPPKIKKRKEASPCSTRPARKPPPPATTISSCTLTARRTARATRGESTWKKINLSCVFRSIRPPVPVQIDHSFRFKSTGQSGLKPTGIGAKRRWVRNGSSLRFQFSRRAGLRVTVKRLLRGYGYPPEKRDRAAEAVLEQAETMAEGQK